jgi:hypothetical protein
MIDYTIQDHLPRQRLKFGDSDTPDSKYFEQAG